MEKSHEIGIDVRPGTPVAAIERDSEGLTVRAVANGKEALFEADLVVHAAGRVPDLESLDLPAADVATGKGRLTLNEFLQSVSNPAVYAVGEAASSGPALTPATSHDEKIVASNMRQGIHDGPNCLGVPSVAFTTPSIASVGMSEQQARDRGMKVRMKSEKASSGYTARRAAESTYGFKVLVDESTELILSAHLIGPHCDEVINIFGLGIRKGLTAEDLKTTRFAYPPATSDIGHMR
jgi:glutathione reductase (NADPH)